MYGICGKQWQQPLMTSRLLSLSFVGCYAKNFGPKGFGYGQGAGALVHAQWWCKPRTKHRAHQLVTTKHRWLYGTHYCETPPACGIVRPPLFLHRQAGPGSAAPPLTDSLAFKSISFTFKIKFRLDLCAFLSKPSGRVVISVGNHLVPSSGEKCRVDTKPSTCWIDNLSTRLTPALCKLKKGFKNHFYFWE